MPHACPFATRNISSPRTACVRRSSLTDHYPLLYAQNNSMSIGTAEGVCIRVPRSVRCGQERLPHLRCVRLGFRFGGSRSDQGKQGISGRFSMCIEQDMAFVSRPKKGIREQRFWKSVYAQFSSAESNVKGQTQRHP